MNRPTSYGFGTVEGIEVGSRFDTIHELIQKGLHHSRSGNFSMTKAGMQSVITKHTDQDFGDTIIIKKMHCYYSKGLDKVQEAFERSKRNNLPVRVIRNHTAGGQYSPLIGYRYDGLFKVTNMSMTVLRDKPGFEVCNITLELLPDQPIFWQRPPPMPSPEELLKSMKCFQD